MAGTIIFLLLAISLLTPVTPFSHGMSREWQNYLEHLIARRIHEHVWFDHNLDETPEERVLWAKIDHAAAPTQELSLRQLSHARRPSFMDYRIRIR